MSVFILLTELQQDSVHHPEDFERLEKRLMSAIQSECHGVRWLSSYALSGPWTYLDVFRAPDVETAARVALLCRTVAHARTEVWPALEWSRFKAVLEELPSEEELIEGHPI